MSSESIAVEFSDSISDRFSNVKSWVSQVDGAYVVNGLIKTKFDNPWFFLVVVPRKVGNYTDFENISKSVQERFSVWTYWSRDLGSMKEAFERKFKVHLVYNITDQVVKSGGMTIRKAPAMAWSDGACAPRNPGGMMGMGGVIRIGSKSLQVMHYVQAAEGNTNNVAEVWAAILVMKRASAEGIMDLTVHCDSKNVVEWFSGRWRVAASHLKPMVAEAKEWMKKFESISFVWIPRDKNVEADALAEEAIRKRFSNFTNGYESLTPASQLQLL